MGGFWCSIQFETTYQSRQAEAGTEGIRHCWEDKEKEHFPDKTHFTLINCCLKCLYRQCAPFPIPFFFTRKVGHCPLTNQAWGKSKMVNQSELPKIMYFLSWRYNFNRRTVDCARKKESIRKASSPPMLQLLHI